MITVKESNQYFDSEKYEVLENKIFILVFKRTFWFKHLIEWKAFAKSCYIWEEDNEMNIIKEIINE